VVGNEREFSLAGLVLFPQLHPHPRSDPHHAVKRVCSYLTHLDNLQLLPAAGFTGLELARERGGDNVSNA
jgi:hypothetical protein